MGNKLGRNGGRGRMCEMRERERDRNLGEMERE